MEHLSHLEVVLRLLAAVGVGLLIGTERELASQPAGLRTHVLVSLGAGLFTLVGATVVGGDPTRIAAQVVTGIGFLGAGAVLRDGLTVHGLTTAASLWVTAALGLAAGLGHYAAAGAATVIALIVLVVLKLIERTFLPSRRGPLVSIDVGSGLTLPDAVAAVRRVVGSVSVDQIQHTDPESTRIELKAQPSTDTDLAALAEALREIPGVRGVSIRR